MSNPLKRKKKSEKILKKMGIVVNENLSCIESKEDVKLKDFDTICKRAIASLISIQLACDINEKGDYEEAKAKYWADLERFGVENELNSLEKRLFDGTYTEQDVIDGVWNYECYWSLLYALGYIKLGKIIDPSKICNCKEACFCVYYHKDYASFRFIARPLKIDKILDLVDLYYRYDWACNEKKINPNVSIGNINPEVVMERRKGLEWLISEEKDWNEVSLNA